MNDTRNNPYAAPASAITQAAGTSPASKAERSTRLLAALADGLLAVPVWLPLVIGSRLVISEKRTAGIVLLVIGLVALIALAVYQLTLLSRHGQTWGKRWQNIRIVRANGERIGFGRLFGLRIIAPAVVGAIPFVGGLFSLANILWIFGSERRCLHDHLADTIVVNT
jgi:uncharacterized RDD family membrane protein YckC